MTHLWRCRQHRSCEIW